MESTEKIFRIVWDEVSKKLRLLAKDRRDLDMVIDYFSDTNPASFFVKQYGYSVPTRVSVINQFGYFEIGLVFEVLKYIKTLYGSFSGLDIDKDTYQLIKERTEPYSGYVQSHPIDEFVISNISKDRSLRDYQENIIRNLIYKGKGSGLFESPTSSGKSFILSNYIWTIHKQIDASAKFLILVPNKQLVEQFYGDMIDYGFNQDWLLKFSAGIKKKELEGIEDKLVIISNRQYLFNNWQNLPKIDVLINDEVHQTKAGSSTIELIENINPKVKVGCSGTLPKSKYELWTLKGLFGKVVHSENLLDLQKSGYITKLNIDRIKVFDKSVDEDVNCIFSLNSVKHFSENSDIAFNEAWDEETKYITDNFNRLYVPVLDYIENSYNGNILILFDRKQFGKDLFEIANEKYSKSRECFYIDGDIDVGIRESIREKVENIDNGIIFAQAATFSTGINIKNLPNLVFCCSGKSFSRVVQSIGRILRLHKSKDLANLIDIELNFKYSTRHTKERNAIYRKIYGKDNIKVVKNIVIG